MSVVLNYGGGRQTVAICVLISRGLLPAPDLFLMADTGRENPSTWAYLARHIQPLLAEMERKVTVIDCPSPPSITYGADDLPILPVFLLNSDGTEGKMSPFCSGTWKRDRMTKWLRDNDIPKGERWIGFSASEKKRVQRFMSRGETQGGWTYRFPLCEMLIDTEACLELIKQFGLPEPPISSCWMCPHKKNKEWRDIRDNHPGEWEKACEMDEEIREQDLFRGGNGMWLHHSRTPLREADLSVDEAKSKIRQCSLGTCFI